METTEEKKLKLLELDGILLGLPTISKEEAIENIGKHLAELGYVEDGYFKYMLERELKSTTFIGNSVAIPHGTLEGKSEVKQAGIVIHQFADGVDFGNGNNAYFLIGIAGKNNEHVDLIANIADIIEDEDRILELSKIRDREEIYRIFSI